MTKLIHPDSAGHPVDVDTERAELLKLNGWVEFVPEPKSDKK